MIRIGIDDPNGNIPGISISVEVGTPSQDFSDADVLALADAIIETDLVGGNAYWNGAAPVLSWVTIDKTHTVYPAQ